MQHAQSRTLVLSVTQISTTSMNLQFTRETCFEPSTSVLVTGGSGTQGYGRAGEVESANASKEDAADCNCLWKEVSSAHENSGYDWTISFIALQDSGPSAKELTSSKFMSCSSLHLLLEDEHYMEPISCTDANTPRTFAVHYSVEETDPTSSGVVIAVTKKYRSAVSLSS